MATDFQTGTITFLFTDVEGSTRLLKGLGRRPYAEVLEVHKEALEAAIAEAGGEVIDRQSEAYFVAFRSASDCVSAAVGAQRRLHSYDWPPESALLVRMGIHTGEAELAGEQYLGLSVHRAARIGNAGHGGQVLVSEVTRALVEDDLPDGVSLRDLGEQQLKDLDRPERLYQLDIEGLPTEFPPLRTAEPETAFAGREGELAEAAKEAVAGRRLYRRSSLLWGGLAGVIAAAVAIPIFAFAGGSGGAGAATVPADAVGVIDSASAKLSSTVETGGIHPTSVAYGEGAIWVANGGSNTVTKIDAETHQAIDTIPVGQAPSAVAVSPGAVWVANNFDGTVWRIDPVTDQRVDTIDVGNGPSALAYGAGAVWVANAGDATLVRIDAQTDKVGEPIAVGADPSGVAFSSVPPTVWVTSRSGNSVSAIDPQANRVIQPVPAGSGPTAVTAAFGSVWVANSLDNTVDQIDARTYRPIGLVRVGPEPTSLAVDERGFVWVGNESGDSVWRIDGEGDGAVTARIRVGSAPAAIAAGQSNVYVASGPSRLAHRGGTLTYLLGHGQLTLDPAVVSNTTTAASAELYDGLVGFRRVGGSEGTQLVPDLATQLPVATDRGLTYTFRLRSGIRYSNGREVQPEDIRYALERSLSLGSTGGYYETIVGAAACRTGPHRCDLHRGIEVDRPTNTVTFHLTRPDPDFLYKLALRAAAAVPTGTPIRILRRHPPPGTGPYMVDRVGPDRFEFVPNPHFQEWSRAAKPAGYIHKLVFEVPQNPAAAVRAVVQGRADIADIDQPGTIPRALLNEILTRYRSRVHFSPLLSTIFLFMNTRLAPFDDVRVRQALNYAVDRRKVVQLFGQHPDSITCQILPPGFLGYHKFCPYTRDPSDRGNWTAPDLAKARKLVRASGTRGMPVTVWEVSSLAGPRVARLLAGVLQSLGYRPRIRFLKDLDTFAAYISDSKNRVQIGGWGWGADYPAPSTFFSALLTCKSFVPNSPANDNQSEFCDPRIDRDVRKAIALQVTDLSASGPRWAKIDRKVMQQAPWVPLLGIRHVNFVSKRVGNYQFNPVLFALLDQMWVR